MSLSQLQILILLRLHQKAGSLKLLAADIGVSQAKTLDALQRAQKRGLICKSSCGYMLTHKGMNFLKSDCYACPHAGEKLCCGGAV